MGVCLRYKLQYLVDDGESSTAVKGHTLNPQKRSLSPSSAIRGKEKSILLPPDNDIIVIGSSDDEVSVKAISPARLSPKIESSPERTFLSEARLVCNFCSVCDNPTSDTRIAKET